MGAGDVFRRGEGDGEAEPAVLLAVADIPGHRAGQGGAGLGEGAGLRRVRLAAAESDAEAQGGVFRHALGVGADQPVGLEGDGKAGAGGEVGGGRDLGQQRCRAGIDMVHQPGNNECFGHGVAWLGRGGGAGRQGPGKAGGGAGVAGIGPIAVPAGARCEADEGGDGLSRGRFGAFQQQFDAGVGALDTALGGERRPEQQQGKQQEGANHARVMRRQPAEAKLPG